MRQVFYELNAKIQMTVKAYWPTVIVFFIVLEKHIPSISPHIFWDQ